MCVCVCVCVSKAPVISMKKILEVLCCCKFIGDEFGYASKLCVFRRAGIYQVEIDRTFGITCRKTH